jgi:peptidoglycan/xylan/chitin deacetylase (PgdA/CDA1 family)
MNRREFTQVIGMGAASLALGSMRGLSAARPPQVAITMDDFTWAGETVRLSGEERNDAILAALKARSVKAALFVRASNIDNDKGKALLKTWDSAGHLIGNHSYSHLYYNSKRITSESFAQDLLRAEELLKAFPRFQKIFRFPYLKEGDTVAKRDAIRSFLGEHGYRTGHVTIDASDWIVDDRLRKRLTRDQNADLAPYREFYLAHMWERALYYDDLARKTLGRPVKHTILVHFSLLNALFLGDLMDMFSRKGWQLTDAEAAFADPVFAARPNIVPAGESIVWALAKETGKFDKLLRYPGEDDVYETPKMDKLGL